MYANSFVIDILFSMLNSNFVILGALINTIGTLSYVYMTIKGKTKPNRITWFIWAVAPFIAFIAQLSKGVGIQSLITFTFGFNPMLVFLASFFNKKSEWKLGTLDIVCGTLSVVGIICWIILKEGNSAIIFSIIADGFATIPTIKKSLQFPETESYYGYLCAAISATITLFTITTWNFAHYAFPAYILVVCLLLTILIKFKLKNHLNYFQNLL